MSRPHVKDLFVRVPKRIEVGFYTSSVDKFLQARLVLEQYGIVLGHFRSRQEPYAEDYSLGKEDLLWRAIEEVKRRINVNSLFFVEDTSVKIAALSTSEEDVPGLRIKEWFAETTFRKADAEIRKHGGDRSAIIYSDIALHVPGMSRPVLFHGETSGHIAETPPGFQKSDQYPWLTPDTFSGWFIPDGASKRLGEMSFEESLQYDFRVRAFGQLVERLEEYAAVLNLPANSYSVKRPRSSDLGPVLFPEDVRLFIVVGQVCAGKTTLGQYASLRHGLRFIEASSIVRMLAADNGIDAPSQFNQAWQVLDKLGPDVVARHIVALFGDELKGGCVITGFRTLEEIQYMREHCPGCKVILVDASERTRFERHLKRGRLGEVRTVGDFRSHDMEQWRFGLLRVAEDIADVRVENEGAMEQYHAQIEAVLIGECQSIGGVFDKLPSSRKLASSRVFRCLAALERVAGPTTCKEIADIARTDHREGNDGQGQPGRPRRRERISERHVNWVLRDIPELARRVDVRGDRVRYELLPAGRTYLRAIRARMDEEKA